MTQTLLIPRYTGEPWHRSCLDCYQDLPASAFWKNGRGYLDSYCKACKRIRSRNEYRRNGLTRRRRRAA